LPSRDIIQDTILSERRTSQDKVRRNYLKKLYGYTKRDTVIYASAFTSRRIVNIPSSIISITTEDIQGFMSALKGLKGDDLDLIIHSPGGSAEAVEQIVQYLRSKYNHIRAIVPQNAMSAATMLACACDEIIMGKHSALGPIDPQITFPTATGQYTAPAKTILLEFEQAKTEILRNPQISPLWMAKVQTIPFGFLQFCQKTIDLSKEKVESWLETYMLRNEVDKSNKANQIAEWLADYDLHKTHGKPISIKEAQEKGLKVLPLEEDQKLQDLVLSVYHSTLVTFDITDCMKFIENHFGKGWYLTLNIPQQSVNP